MRYSLLASDYDGTLALDGRVLEPALDALYRYKQAAGRFVLVTGRDLDDLRNVFPEYRLCDLIVAENGALVYDPATGREELLADPPPPRFIHELEVRNVTPILPGRVIVSTRQPHEREVTEVIARLQLQLRVIYNKGAVMVLPAHINKAVGLTAALERLRVPAEQVVAVGDAENDHSLIAAAGLGAAVSNALQSLCDECDILLDKPASAGVAQLLEMLLAGDPRLVRRRPTVGEPVREVAAAVEEGVPGAR